MIARPRPLIAVRLIGPADAVAAHKDHLIKHFQTVYGLAVTCRTSTRHASHRGECRTYLSVTANLLRPNGIPPTDSQENTT